MHIATLSTVLTRHYDGFCHDLAAIGTDRIAAAVFRSVVWQSRILGTTAQWGRMSCQPIAILPAYAYTKVAHAMMRNGRVSC